MQLVVVIFLAAAIGLASAFTNVPRSLNARAVASFKKTPATFNPQPTSFGSSIIAQRAKPLKDILGLGPAEIAITLVVALVLFGPETLKSLSKDVGRAAAELKEIPKTFKEGMDEGSESVQISKMKALAAEKRKKRDAKLSSQKDGDDEDDDEEEPEEKK